MMLYRPVGLQELELIYDNGMQAFPARLPQQPIFYPVLDLEYARQTASDWNAKNGQAAGYVTQFKVEDQYLGQFETHTVGKSQYQEFWIPSEEVEKFNQHIVGHIKVVEAYFGEAFQGFVPETFGLGGKNAVEQFTLLANSYVYKRMEFYLEVKRNHKAVFLNYPFWQKYDFKNPGLKAKVIQAIKDAWLTSFPKIPLVTPVHEEVMPVKQNDAPSLVNPVHEDSPPLKKTNLPSKVTPIKPTNSQSFVNPVDEHVAPVKPTPSKYLVDDFDEEIAPIEPTASKYSMDDLNEDVPSVEETHSQPLVSPVDEDTAPREPATSKYSMDDFDEEVTPLKQTVSHFLQGVELGLSGKIHAAIDELSKAVEEDPNDVVAHTSLGVAFHRLGEDDRALACYEDALQIDPDDAEAHYFRANILYSQGNAREAIAGYTIASGLKPGLIEAYQKASPQDQLTDYSPVLAEMRRVAKHAHRILDLTQSLASNPGQANLFKERAVEYYRLWNYEQAVADYSSSLALEPDDADALHFRGVAYEQLGQFDHAREDYQRAIAIQPQLADVYIHRGVTFGKSGNFRQSISSLTEALRLAPRNPDAYFNRGTSYFQLGDLEKAIEDFSVVIQLSPNDEAAYYWRGLSNEEAGRRREAIADYQQFLNLSQDANAREEIEQKLNQWNEGTRNGPGTAHRGQDRHVNRRSAVPDERQITNQVSSKRPDQDLDLYDLIAALGERALSSTWLGRGVRCSGEKAEELYAFTEQDKPIHGGDLLQITSGIRQTMEGDFTAFDPGATSHWLFIHAWDGRGFYIEINDPKSRDRLKTHFQAMEEVEGATPPYEGLLIRI